METIPTSPAGSSKKYAPTLGDGVSDLDVRRPRYFGFLMRLFLFDIDGTLVRVRTGVRAAIMGAVQAVTGRKPSLEGIEFSGRTDPEIFQDVFRTNNLPATPRTLRRTISTYEGRVRDAVTRDDVEVLPGAASLLSTLQEKEDVLLGLVTGNVKTVARHKLRTADLETHFSTGAFGSDRANRSDLPSLARLRASLQAGTPIRASETVVIGDTVNDVTCARDSGNRSVAVSTGRPTRSELASSTPDLLLESLKSRDLVSRLLAL